MFSIDLSISLCLLGIIAFLLGWFTLLTYSKIGILSGVFEMSLLIINGIQLQNLNFITSIALAFIGGAIFGWLGAYFREKRGD